MPFRRVTGVLGLGFVLAFTSAQVTNAAITLITVSTRKGQELLAEAIVATKQQKDFHFSCLETLSRDMDVGSEDCSKAFADINKFSASIQMGTLKPADMEAFRHILFQIKLKSTR
jgi:hypothetical protein